MATVLESSKVSPSAGCSPSEPSLPLVFFDMFWYDRPAPRVVIMFDIPRLMKVHFLNDIVPRLKKSLSLTLNHFFPLAGNIIHPLSPNPLDMPVLRYESTDSVSFTVCESAADFTHLTGDHPRNCDEFQALVPFLPGATRSNSSISCPILALQVTLFPGKGISIGFATHHVVADASTVVSFIRSWALISQIGADAAGADPLTEANLSPFLDRKTVTNINGLDSAYWDGILKFSSSVEPPPVESPVNKLRATFVLKREEIEKLKHLVRVKSPSVAHVSLFTVVCALVWACSAKSAGEDAADDEPEYFRFTVDCRGRLKPALPATYFGNCVAVMKAELMHGQVKGGDGFVMAAAAIGAELNRVGKGSRILDGAEKWPEECAKLAGKRCYAVSGSPRFDFYAADFGWGRPKKIEVVSIDDGAGAISLWASRDFEGGVEIGVSKPADQMDAFAKVFNHTLAQLLHHGSLSSIPLFSRY